MLMDSVILDPEIFQMVINIDFNLHIDDYDIIYDDSVQFLSTNHVTLISYSIHKLIMK